MVLQVVLIRPRAAARAKHPALGVREKLQRAVLVLVARHVVGDVAHRGGAAPQRAPRVILILQPLPRAERDSHRLVQVVVGDAAQALVQVGREVAVGVVGELGAGARLPIVAEVARARGCGIVAHVRQAVAGVGVGQHFHSLAFSVES